jgi:hypothetical protein
MNPSTRQSNETRPRVVSLRYLLFGVLLVGVGAVVGSVATEPRSAWGEVRAPAAVPHFQSGDQLSLPLLQEISATLRQIDSRLARLEAVAKLLGNKQVPPPGL